MLPLLLALVTTTPAAEQTLTQVQVISVEDEAFATRLQALPTLTIEDPAWLATLLRHDDRLQVLAAPTLMTVDDEPGAFSVQAAPLWVEVDVRAHPDEAVVELEVQVRRDESDAQGHHQELQISTILAAERSALLPFGDLLVVTRTMSVASGTLEGLDHETRLAEARWETELAGKSRAARRRVLERALNGG